MTILERTWSHYQERIFDQINSGGNLIVQAGPGSGKTTTAIEFANRTGKSGMVCAFNSHIVKEIETKVTGTKFKVRTVHSLGKGALYRVINPVMDDDSETKYQRIAMDIVKESSPLRILNEGDLYITARQMAKLCDFARLTLTKSTDTMLLDNMAQNYELDYQGEMLPYVQSVLDRGMEMARKTGYIDFTDMIYLPNAWNLAMSSQEWVVVDETQDISAAQAGIIGKMMKSNSRLLAIGDVRQSLQAFAGASPDSMGRIKREFDCTELPLSICYRCPKSHVELARSIFDNIEPSPGAKDGTISRADRDAMLSNVRPGDMILSRNNAAAISACIDMVVKKNRNARVRGRDVGNTLAQTIKDIGGDCKSYNDFPNLVDTWYNHKLAAMGDFPPSSRLTWLNDTKMALKACFDGFGPQRSITDLMDKVRNIFSDSQSAITLSTIHRSKGLEADRVWIMDYDELGTADEDATQTEVNTERMVKFVAVTRSKDTLYLC